MNKCNPIVHEAISAFLNGDESLLTRPQFNKCVSESGSTVTSGRSIASVSMNDDKMILSYHNYRDNKDDMKVGINVYQQCSHINDEDDRCYLIERAYMKRRHSDDIRTLTYKAGLKRRTLILDQSVPRMTVRNEFSIITPHKMFTNHLFNWNNEPKPFVKDCHSMILNFLNFHLKVMRRDFNTCYSKCYMK